ncbi:MAG: hypothetical protein ACM3ML_32610 [Micromonosporaceae bacterium]
MTSGRRKLSAGEVRRLTMDPGPWLSCDVCFQLVDQYVELLLTDAAWHMPGMRAHLRGCSACAEEAASLLLLAAEDAGVDPAPALRRLHDG